MKTQSLKRAFLFFACALFFGGSAFAAAKGSKEEAQALVKRIIAYHKQYGREKAIAEGNNPNGQFRDRDLYIFAYLADGTNVIHSNPKMVGRNLLEMKDADGVPLIREMIKVGTSAEGKGWIKYKWPNSVTQTIEQKSSYIEKYGDIIYACGFYEQ